MNISGRLINMSMRGITLVSRFLFMFFLARFLHAGELGLYGLFTATVGYALYLVGLDFYTYATREILKVEGNGWGWCVKNQIALSLALYAIFLPLLAIIFFKGILPPYLAIWFFPLLILEHLNQEVGRLLVAVNQQFLASAVLFVRQGSWAILMVVLMSALPSMRSLNFMFAAWLLADICAVILAVVRIKRLGVTGWGLPINWQWVRQGLKVCVPFLFATLALQGIFTLDRYWLKYLSGLELVGSYVLFMGIASTLLTFLDAGVFAFSYPALIRLYRDGDKIAFRKAMKGLMLNVLGFSVIFAASSLLILPLLLQWVGNPVHAGNQGVYYLLLFAMVVNALGMIPHYGLYAQGLDKPIVISHIAAFFVFSGAVWLLSILRAELAVPLALCLTFVFILFFKMVSYFMLTPPGFGRD